ncbi:MAG: tRNA pseudouridine(13) synthase TruD [Gemmataceae bacterium]
MSRPDLTTPLFTPDFPGLGGRIKVRLEDFEVEEIPSYEPCGIGDHLYLWIEKKGVGSEHFTQAIARKVGVPVGTVGMAGLKDRQAVSRQWVSVPKEAEPNLGKLDGDGMAVLKVSRHGNKLKPGHLKGNRFRILIREANRQHAESAEKTIAKIRAEGLPNYYGPQRFGRGGETAEIGFRVLNGQQRQRLRPFLFKFALSAAQSVLFNRVLAQRQLDGLLRTVLPGDVMMKLPFGGIFVADDVTVEQARFDARETVHAGPMFGSRTFATKGIAAEREAKILADSGLSPKAFSHFGKLASGTRRHNLIYLDDLTSEWEPDGLRLTFSLPAGSYATVLLREVMKVDLSEPDDDDKDTDDE